MTVQPAAAAATPTPHTARHDNHPGTVNHGEAVDRALSRALAALPADYRPRTRHHGGREHGGAAVHADPYAPAGAKPDFTNRLLLETSPYLRQHAHNPVDWRPWGPEAFAEARALGRPIFLSVGYSTCHWCHVMEHESFEDLEIARVLNSRYVPIKLDREERPDVDAVYMAAVQAMGIGGGWPMSVWIAPGEGGPGQEVHGLPFFAGTYFPPRGFGGRRPGFLGICGQLADRYADDAAGILVTGRRIAAHIAEHLERDAPGAMADTGATDRVLAEVAAAYDPQHGGLRRAPKFPSNVPHGVLLRHHLRTGRPEGREMAHHTLRRMSMGGIYDHVGGGFARYSTDTRWLVPHFEKMLYDQGLIVRDLVEAYVATGDEEHARVIRETLDALLREMRHPGGAFYSATDADSEGEEGRYFIWSVAELQTVLGAEDGALVAEVYGATAAGNFEGRNILHLERDLTAHALRLKTDEGALRLRLRAALDKLRGARAERVPPLRDDKLLTSWNGLVIGALALAGAALPEPRYVAAAERSATHLLRVMRGPDGRLLRTALGDEARLRAYLDDHAFLIEGLLDLFEASGHARWLEEALTLQAQLDRHYAAKDGAGYYLTASDAQSLLARELPDHDGALPSGNSVAAMNLVRLAALTGSAAHRDRAQAVIGAFSGRLRQVPMALSRMLNAVEAMAWPMKEVILVAPAGSPDDAFEPMLAALRRTWQPHRVVVRVREGEELARLLASAPPVRGKVARGGTVTAYVCRDGACKLPTTDPATLRTLVLER